MKKFTLLLLAWLLTVNTLHATIRRVGYAAPVNPVSGLDFPNFQAAHDASSNNDTIQLYASPIGSVIYTGTITKPLIIMGPGYFTNSYYLTGTESANTGLQNMAGSMTSCTFTIDLGSAGTTLMGLNNVTINTIDRVEALNNIKVNRCRNVNVSFTNSGNCNNWTIAQCYGVTISQSGFSPSFILDRSIDNLSIQNCVIASGINLNTSPGGGAYTGNSIYNSIFLSGGSLSLNGAFFTIQNCIFDVQTFTAVTNTIFKNNVTAVFAGGSNVITNTGSNSGNIFGATLSNVFVGYPTNALVGGVNQFSPDGRLQLKTGTNPAIGGGLVPGTTTVTNCGIYGGLNTYILSGIPPVPVVYQLGAASTVTSGSNYTLTFSIKSNN